MNLERDCIKLEEQNQGLIWRGAVIDAMYTGKLDGKVDAAFFDRKAANGGLSGTGF